MPQQVSADAAAAARTQLDEVIGAIGANEGNM